MSNTRHDFKIMAERIGDFPGVSVHSYKPGAKRLYSLRLEGGHKLSDSLPMREFLAFLNGFEAGSTYGPLLAGATGEGESS